MTYILKSISRLKQGLAGGSADGAGVIVGLDRLFKTDMGTQKLCDIGLKIGSDVPFCISGGTMLSQHTGRHTLLSSAA